MDVRPIPFFLAFSLICFRITSAPGKSASAGRLLPLEKKKERVPQLLKKKKKATSNPKQTQDNKKIPILHHILVIIMLARSDSCFFVNFNVVMYGNVRIMLALFCKNIRNNVNMVV